jgi:hypothetical protein
LIEFGPGAFTLKLVIHELFHAYSKYLFLASADLNVGQVEEIYAEFWEVNLFKFTRMAREIYRGLK